VGFGLPALEAMTIGLPVVAANRGSLPEVLGASGILVDPDDPAGIADAMQRLLEDPALRREQAARGVARASDFSWETSAARLAGAFQEALVRARDRA
jgi:glycosyltransferase involved in cell wall biosynthesis